jgi:D-alanyl-D-alanine carboxypeptidase/D-alanyl-D-alanine-endopeptidase (penicillin-binding protein 4)
LATSAAKGTGDKAFIYLPVSTSQASVRGTIPINENHFIISGAMVNPGNQFIETIVDSLKDRFKQPRYLSAIFLNEQIKKEAKIIHTEYSPSLDSIIYWFNKKSVNLYGEALIKTFAYEKKGVGSTDSGVIVVKNFWKQKGIDADAINIVDDSGLSPQNRVTSHAQTEILKYAKSKDWYPYFFNSLPQYNGMVMKSGTIRGVKGFCGYHRSKKGKEYIFSFLVNNYNGSPDALVKKMYKVLDILK